MINWNNYNSKWKKLLGFSNLQEKIEKGFISSNHPTPEKFSTKRTYNVHCANVDYKTDTPQEIGLEPNRQFHQICPQKVLQNWQMKIVARHENNFFAIPKVPIWGLELNVTSAVEFSGFNYSIGKAKSFRVSFCFSFILLFFCVNTFWAPTN